eukprot:scaffold29622_cov67-Phaeocystis_antarctica.AAC.4
MIHAAAERGRALGRDEEAARPRGGVCRRGRRLPAAGWAGGRGERDIEDFGHQPRHHGVVSRVAELF